MKKTIILFITVLMLLAMAGCGNKPVSPEGTEDQPESTITLPKMGMAFDLPLSPDDLKGVILYSDASEVGGGVYQGRLAYCAIGADRYVELIQKKQLSEEEREFVNRRIVTLVGVVVMDGNRPRSDLEQMMGSYGYDSTGLVELGTAGEYRFFCQVNPEKKYLDSYYIFDEDYFREEFDWLANMLEDTSIIRLFEPNREGKDFTGNTVSFETVDIDGNKVSSADIFSKHKLTMINIWGTFCGPCIREMPDLEELRARLESKNCAIIGVVCDISGQNDQNTIEAAKEIIKTTGVSYLNLLPWKQLDADMPASAIPTTYFVDENGRIVSNPIVGAGGADDYEAVIDQILATME